MMYVCIGAHEQIKLSQMIHLNLILCESFSSVRENPFLVYIDVL